MRTSTSFAFLFAFTALVGCAADESSSDVEPASATQALGCSGSELKARFDRAIAAAQAQLQTDYSAAMAAFDADVEQAKRDLAEKLASQPQGPESNESSDVLNAAMNEYNEKIGPNGPLVAAYDRRVEAAKARYETSTDAAVRAYQSGVCR